jgi:ankyrin repeat/BTB/POZ domain-containing protein 1
MTDTVLRKDQLELSLHNEKKLIHEGALKEDNPLDFSEGFRVLCDACRRGDLKVCQEKISEGVNINARDSFDYTPLILVTLFASVVHFGRHSKAELVVAN